MKPRSSNVKSPAKAPAERVVKDIRRQTRRHFSAEDKIRIVLDGLRKQRNLSDYDGAPISPTVVEACQSQATALLARVRAWLATHRPDLC